ncbi:hypothetical protein [Streptomyces sp. KHY 26]|uniref:hypothetical protein n=1 Tax=Streptomyces sp. KHY 26 TaxID=3097359 RepID=UPI00376F0FCE
MGARGPVRWGRRLAAVAVALAAVVGGISWWVKDRLDAQVRFAAVPSPASLVGTWKLEDVTTGQIRFTGDDRFTATALPLEVFTVPSDGTFARRQLEHRRRRAVRGAEAGLPAVWGEFG